MAFCIVHFLISTEGETAIEIVCSEKIVLSLSSIFAILYDNRRRVPMKIINIPAGTSNFAEIRRKGSYFIDKTGLIVQLMKTQSTKATLITRPRRFGKTLCMSMLSEFFDIQKESRHFFAGLSVMENEELCRQWMNQYLTLSLTFRSVDGLDFSGAYAQLVSVIAELYKKHSYLTESERIHPLDKEQFHRIAAEKSDLKDIKNSLLKLTRLMELYYEKPVILLIDENVGRLGIAFFRKKCLVKKM